MTTRTSSQLKQLAQTFCLAISLGLASSVFADQNRPYSEGLKAYLSGDYEVAQSFWLQGARASDAKSMFNLGLLHQQEKITKPDLAKAEKWFRLAAKSGYAPAAYHLAMWLQERGAAAQDVNELLRLAANAGFAPAVMKLSGTAPEVQVTRGSRTAVSAMAKNTPSQVSSSRATSKQNAKPRYQDETWIKSLSPKHWTIQMLAFKEQSKVRSFIDDHQLYNDAAYFAETSSGSRLYKLIYGSYTSKDQAEAARQNLSATLREYGPWLRPVSAVQAVIANQ